MAVFFGILVGTLIDPILWIVGLLVYGAVRTRPLLIRYLVGCGVAVVLGVIYHQIVVDNVAKWGGTPFLDMGGRVFYTVVAMAIVISTFFFCGKLRAAATSPK